MFFLCWLAAYECNVFQLPASSVWSCALYNSAKTVSYLLVTQILRTNLTRETRVSKFPHQRHLPPLDSDVRLVMIILRLALRVSMTNVTMSDGCLFSLSNGSLTKTAGMRENQKFWDSLILKILRISISHCTRQLYL